MDTTFRFSSANEITEEFIEKLKSFYNGKPVSITVTEDFKIPRMVRKQKFLKELTLKRIINRIINRF